MTDLPLLIAIATAWGWVLGVGIMVVRARRHNRKKVGLVPEQRGERLMWLVWVPLMALWCALPWLAATRSHGPFALPEFARGEAVYAALRWLAMAIAIAAYLAVVKCWLRMGDDWRMDVGERKTDLITDGLFSRIRHPIYAFSMLLMICTALIVPTAPMIAVAAVQVLLWNLKARNEERHLTAVHGDGYRAYVARTGRFFPRG